MHQISLDIGLDRETADRLEESDAQTSPAAQAVAIVEGNGSRADPAVVDPARHIGELAQGVGEQAAAQIEFVAQLEAAADRRGIEVSGERPLIEGHRDQIGLETEGRRGSRH